MRNMLPSLRIPNTDILFRPLAANLPAAKLFIVYRKNDASPLARKFLAHVEKAKAELNPRASAHK